MIDQKLNYSKTYLIQGCHHIRSGAMLDLYRSCQLNYCYTSVTNSVQLPACCTNSELLFTV